MRTSDELKIKQKELSKRLLKINDKMQLLRIQEGILRDTLQNIENKLYATLSK